jgi:hypothetical protein
MIDTHLLTGEAGIPPAWGRLIGPSRSFDLLPEGERRRILFLDALSSALAYRAIGDRDILCGDDGWGNTPFAGGCFASVERWAIEDFDTLRDWLRQKPVEDEAPAILLPTGSSHENCVILAPWYLVVAMADEVFYSDDVVIVSPDGSWCIYYHHDEIVTFAHGWLGTGG